jgi:predicted alpha/beta-fold hydrolase
MTIRIPIRSEIPTRGSDWLADWLTPFEPNQLLSGGHVQTLAGNYWLRPAALAIPVEAEAVEVDSADGSRVLCYGHWQPEATRSTRLTILLVHGLEGSSDSQAILGLTAKAWNAGCNVVRMNMRNCGGTEAWTPTLCHSGLSADVGAVLRHYVQKHGLERVAMAGYSMGGNLVLKLAGELASQSPAWLRAAAAVSPPADLAPSADAVHEPANRLYEWYFLSNLLRRFRRKASLFPDTYSTQGVGSVRSMREFDDRITAPYSGFAGADDYYLRASSGKVLSRIAIPTLVLHALDDPFIRITAETRETLRRNSSIEYVESPCGGHCGFLAAPSLKAGTCEYCDLHWAESTLIRFLMVTAGHTEGGN